MNWLDNVIAFISPQTGAKREAWRQELNSMRNYDAGGYGRNNTNWNVHNESAEMTDRYDRDLIRARARDLERNSDITGAIISAYKRNVIGKGFKLQARTGSESLNSEIEELWQEWCKKRNCDVTGTQSFNELMRMALQRKIVDGGLLFLKCYTNQGIVPFQLQALEVDELETTQLEPKNKNNKVVGGIEYNQYNRPVGYWIKQYSINGMEIIEPRYVEAKDVIYIFKKTRPSQIREMSELTTVIPRVRDTNEFVTAVSVKERIAACLSVFIKRVIPQTGGIGRGTPATPRETYQGKTLSPGMIKELNAGDEIQVVEPKGQATEATGFLKLMHRIIGAGKGLSYEAVTRDMSETNYSSARQGAIEDELTYTEEIEALKEGFMDEVYESFLISCVLSGKINIGDFWENKGEYFKHDWVESPKKWIDPLKEANSNKIALQTGQKTFKQIAAENGKDWKDQVNEMAEIIEYGKEKGIDLGGVIYGIKAEKQYDESATAETEQE